MIKVEDTSIVISDDVKKISATQTMFSNNVVLRHNDYRQFVEYQVVDVVTRRIYFEHISTPYRTMCAN